MPSVVKDSHGWSPEATVGGQSPWGVGPVGPPGSIGCHCKGTGAPSHFKQGITRLDLSSRKMLWALWKWAL